MLCYRVGALAVIAPLLFACASSDSAEKADPAPVAEAQHEDSLLEIARQTHDYAPWGYDEAKGPKAWGGLDSHYAVCGNGPFQSPIDVTSGENLTSGTSAVCTGTSCSMP